MFTSTMPFPGFAVLLPCVGAAAIIFVGSNARTTCWLANPLAQAIGASSYSLYLCHWPLIFFTRFIFGPEVMTATTDAILIAIMVITATAMYFFVEKPFIHGRSRRSCRDHERPYSAMAVQSCCSLRSLTRHFCKTGGHGVFPGKKSS